MSVAVFAARPGANHVIVPQSKYYISRGTYIPGQIIDVATIPRPQLIDFTGNAGTMAKVEHNPDGTWTVTYN